MAVRSFKEMRLVRREQLAEYLSLKPATIQDYERKKRWDMIPPPIKVGGRVRWDLDFVDKWLRERQVRITAESKAKTSPNRRAITAQH